MYLIAIAWIYVALMMALAEAFSPQGGVLGAVITFALYGLAPVAVLMYILGTPMRRRAREQREQRESRERQSATAAAVAATEPAPPTPPTPSTQPDQGGLPPGEPVAPVREEP